MHPAKYILFLLFYNKDILLLKCWKKTSGKNLLNSTVKMATAVLFNCSSLNAHCQRLPCHCYILFLELHHHCLAWKKPFLFLSSLNGKVLQLSVREGAVPTYLCTSLCTSLALPWTRQYWKNSWGLGLHPSSLSTDGSLQTYKTLKMPSTEDFKTHFNADNLDSQ